MFAQSWMCLVTSEHVLVSFYYEVLNLLAWRIGEGGGLEAKTAGGLWKDLVGGCWGCFDI